MTISRVAMMSQNIGCLRSSGRAAMVNGLYAPAGLRARHRTVVSYPSSLMLQDWLVRVNGFLFWLPIVKEWCLSLSLSSSFPSRAARGTS
ncbi:unnamed protein product [Prunus brigantina]